MSAYILKWVGVISFSCSYVDDIFPASNNLNLLHDTKGFLSQNFEMKDMGEAFYIIGIEIHKDISRSTLGLSQKAYIEKKFRLHS